MPQPGQEPWPGATRFARVTLCQAGGDAVVVERHLDAAGSGRLEGEAEESLRVLGVEVLAAEAVDTAEAESAVRRVVLEGRLDLMTDVRPPGAARGCPLADEESR